MWNITWPATNVSTFARQKCPGGSEAQGKNLMLLGNVIKARSFFIREYSMWHK